MSELYVAYIGTSIMFRGTKKECTEHRESRPYATDCWRISDIETFGEYNYSEGYDEGYNAGQDSD